MTEIMSMIGLCGRRRHRRRPTMWQLLDGATSDLPELCGCDPDHAVTCAACALDTSGELASH